MPGPPSAMLRGLAADLAAASVAMAAQVPEGARGAGGFGGASDATPASFVEATTEVTTEEKGSQDTVEVEDQRGGSGTRTPTENADLRRVEKCVEELKAFNVGYDKKERAAKQLKELSQKGDAQPEALNGLIEEGLKGAYFVQTIAVEAMHFGGVVGVTALANAMDKGVFGSKTVRQHAVRQLMWIGNNAENVMALRSLSLSPLTKVIHEEKVDDIRETAAEALVASVDWSHDRYVKHLAQALEKDKQSRVRWHAAKGLFEIASNNPEMALESFKVTIKATTKALEDSDSMNIYAVDTLATIGGTSAEEDARWEALKSLAEALPNEKLKEDTRARVAKALGDIGDHKFLGILAKAVRGHLIGNSLGRTMVKALGDLVLKTNPDDMEGVDVLKEVLLRDVDDLNTKSRSARFLNPFALDSAAAKALGAIGGMDSLAGARARDALTEFAQKDLDRAEDHPEISTNRQIAYETLGAVRAEIATPESKTFLAEAALREPDAYAREYAFEALANVGGGAEVGVLSEALLDDHLSHAAKFALVRIIEDKETTPQERMAALRALEGAGLLTKAFSFPSQAQIKYLVKLGGVSATTVLSQALTRDTRVLPATGREMAAKGLGEIYRNGKETQEARQLAEDSLQQASKDDEDEKVVQAAQGALQAAQENKCPAWRTCCRYTTLLYRDKVDWESLACVAGDTKCKDVHASELPFSGQPAHFDSYWMSGSDGPFLASDFDGELRGTTSHECDGDTPNVDIDKRGTRRFVKRLVAA